MPLHVAFATKEFLSIIDQFSVTIAIFGSIYDAVVYLSRNMKNFKKNLKMSLGFAQNAPKSCFLLVQLKMNN